MTQEEQTVQEAKGCEEDKNLPSGYGYRPASREVMKMKFSLPDYYNSRFS